MATEEGYEEYHQGYDTGDYFHDGAQGDKVRKYSKVILAEVWFFMSGGMQDQFLIYSL